MKLIDTVDEKNKQSQVQRQLCKKALDFSKKRAREIGAVGDDMNSPEKRACAGLVDGMRDKTNEAGKDKPLNALASRRIDKESVKQVLLACFEKAFDGELYAELEAEIRFNFTDKYGPV